MNPSSGAPESPLHMAATDALVPWWSVAYAGRIVARESAWEYWRNFAWDQVPGKRALFRVDKWFYS